MNKFEALEEIRNLWKDNKMKLGEKISKVSNAYYSEGLDLASTAAFIKATPSELDSFLSLGEFDDDILEMISLVNPPKTTWTMLGNASDEEVMQALKALNQGKLKGLKNHNHYTFSEFVYQKMIELSGPTSAQIIGTLSSENLKHILKKGEDFGKLNDWQRKFLKGVAATKKKGRPLTTKQVDKLIATLSEISDNGVITRNSIDGDEELCNKILDALGK